MKKFTIKNHDGIYADMYGRTVKDISDIIFIEKENLEANKDEKQMANIFIKNIVKGLIELRENSK